MNAPRLRMPHSFRDKVSALVTLTSGVAIVAVSFALAVVNHLDLERAMFDALDAQASIVAMNSGAPMVFGDRASATEALAAFRAMPSVAAASLEELDGSVFATYRRPAPAGEAPAAGAAGVRSSRQVTFTTRVQEKGQPLGELKVVFDLARLRAHLWQSLMLAATISVFGVAFALLFSRGVARVITRPVAELGRLAQRISETRDYSLRARKGGDDEIGAFTDTFNEMLEQIQRQDIDIKTSREEAQVASRMKDEFLATLSHELRTPMTPIVGWAQILRRIGSGDARVLKAAEVIERNAFVQTRIIDDLLDMSRIISGKMRLETGMFDLRDAVSGALEAVREAAHAKRIAITTDIEADVPPLRGDVQRIQQVLWNLLSNAIKFTPEEGRIRLRAWTADEHVRVAVSDTGRGIAAGFLPHAFERFRQADSSITRAHGGLGLGLSIVKQLVELHGGTVSADSEGPGQGSTFTLVLPVPQGAEPLPEGRAGEAPSQATPAPLAGRGVWVVDDEGDTREWLAQVLADAGASVLAWRSAGELLAALAGATPDVLVCDIGMPDVDGYALMRRIRALPGAAGVVPAIALTAFARAEDRARALAAGYQAHLGKPVGEAELVAAVARALSTPASRDAIDSREGLL
jgi:signal transduction histidine kinase/ActR/RegA family two-component response regulator